jgi:plasmid stabilization system protein ParE
VSRSIIVRKEAEIEIAEAAVGYEERRSSLGRQLIESIDRAFMEIADRPRAWPLWRPNRVYRKYVVSRFPFVVFYKGEEVVIVVAVAHAKRRPGYWLIRERG